MAKDDCIKLEHIQGAVNAAKSGEKFGGVSWKQSVFVQKSACCSTVGCIYGMAGIAAGMSYADAHDGPTKAFNKRFPAISTWMQCMDSRALDAMDRLLTYGFEGEEFLSKAESDYYLRTFAEKRRDQIKAETKKLEAELQDRVNHLEAQEALEARFAEISRLKQENRLEEEKTTEIRLRNT